MHFGDCMDRNISIIKDLDERKIVVINDIYFKGKRRIKWKDVEEYLKQYIGDFYEVLDEKDSIYIGKDGKGKSKCCTGNSEIDRNCCE